MPGRRVLDAHPPSAHWSFFVIWALTASIGPIGVVVGLIESSSTWLVGLAIYGVALITMGIDWMVVQRLRAGNPAWSSWEPPRFPLGH